jgi:hypothetical protein
VVLFESESDVFAVERSQAGVNHLEDEPNKTREFQTNGQKRARSKRSFPLITVENRHERHKNTRRAGIHYRIEVEVECETTGW